MTPMVCPQAPSDDVASLLAEAARLEASGEPATLCTIVEVSGSAPRGLGARMIVYDDGRTIGTIGGGSLEQDLIDRCQAGDIAEPMVVRYDLARDVAMACGGAVRILLEPLGQTPWLLLFGAGHVARALAPLAARCAFRVAVVDSDSRFCCADRFPEATMLVPTFDPTAWTGLPLDQRGYAVIVTGDHAQDARILGHLLAYPFPYLGMIGSRRKVAQVLAALAEQGASAEALARVRAPIGLNIGAETPSEIAVSILAEMIAVRRRCIGRIGAPLSDHEP